jgi:lipopolysaccharide transport system ATP-binding protein
MSGIAIHVENIGKCYRVGERQRYLALRDILSLAVKNAFRFKGARRSIDYLWALRDVSFDVREGEVIGLVGRNGAGKTTLLKILSRITRPTLGLAEIHGRAGSLLEVGTGFHPELTGRENVYLSGAILGMKRMEILQKFDAIVDFAAVERFIDTPLKHFSTGMQMRLAFAVAAHLEPEILLVDEVLAVGDLEFQKRCLGKMQEVSNSGRTIVLVSHQMNQIRRLCQRCLWIDDGKIRLSGSTLEVLSAYESSFSSCSPIQKSDGVEQKQATRFVNWSITNSGSNDIHVLDGFDTIAFEFSLVVNEPIRDGVHGAALYNSDHQLIWATSVANLNLNPGLHALCFTLPSLPLRPGVYHWQVSIWESGQCLDQWTCVPDMIVATKPVTHPEEKWQGILNSPWEFKVVERDSSTLGREQSIGSRQEG